jgi:hypothetical protein
MTATSFTLTKRGDFVAVAAEPFDFEEGVTSIS